MAAVASPERPRGAARREALLEAVLRIVADVGPDAVTHRRVAEEAQLPLASTTYWFDSKEHLLTAAALNPEIRSLLIWICEVELREEQRTVGQRHVRASAVPSADSRSLAIEPNAICAEALAAWGTAIDDGRVREPARRQDVRAIARQLSPALEQLVGRAAEGVHDRILIPPPPPRERLAE